MSVAPKPTKFEEELLDVLEFIPKLADEYRWGYDFAFAIGGGQSGDKVSHGDSDPTADLYQARGQARYKLKVADRKIRFAKQVLAEALGELQEISDPDPLHPKPPGLPAPGAEGVIDNGHNQPGDRGGPELRALKDAQARRHQRGEGWGRG